MGTATSKPARLVHVTSVKFTADEHAALKALAAMERRSLSNQLRHLVAQEAAAKGLDRKAAA